MIGLTEKSKWNYELWLNGVYWKGYSFKPFGYHLHIAINDFTKSEYYRGGRVKVDIKDNID